MERITAWLTLNTGHSVTEPIWSAAEERQAMRDVEKQATLILNDELDKAQDLLSKGTTPFHLASWAILVKLQLSCVRLIPAKLAQSAALFIRATIGGEREMIDCALSRLRECEDVANDYRKRAIADSSSRAFRSAIHSVGTEYALTAAFCQLLYVVASVSSGAGWTKIIAGLLKVRGAHALLKSARRAEVSYANQISPEKDLSLATSRTIYDSAEDDATDYVDIRAVTSEPIDLFMHVGVATCLGMIDLLLSFIPRAFAKVISILGFDGNRSSGIKLLWSASAFSDNIFGGVSALVLCMFYNAGVAVADIIPHNYSKLSSANKLFHQAQKQYPNSPFWVLEQARVAKASQKLDSAVLILNGKCETILYPQLAAQAKFELALYLMYLRRYDEAARCSLECINLDKWSHGFYYFLAGINYLELYRAQEDRSSPEKEGYAALARMNLDKVVPNSKQRFVGRRAPLDAFLNGKINKWRARATSHKCDIIDAIGVSPCEEITYLWSGYHCMRPEQLEAALASLHAYENLHKNPGIWNEEVDEFVFLAVLKAVCLRQLGRTGEAKGVLEREVFVHDLKAVRAGPHASDEVWACGHYEMACCIWQLGGRENGTREQVLQSKHHLDIFFEWSEYAQAVKFSIAKETLEACLALFDG